MTEYWQDRCLKAERELERVTDELDCANERKRGQSVRSRVQPADHPWRRSIAA